MIIHPKRNIIATLGKTGLIFTRNGLILIDSQDIPLVRNYHWCIDRNSGYCVTQTGGKKQYLHRLILQTPPGMQTDHIDGRYKNDNRRCNLRLVDASLNQLNRFRANRNSKSKALGVRWRPKLQKWEASITINNRWRYLGLYKSKLEAIIIRGIILEDYLESIGISTP
jgi:hypothetical protein